MVTKRKIPPTTSLAPAKPHHLKLMLLLSSMLMVLLLQCYEASGFRSLQAPIRRHHHHHRHQPKLGTSLAAATKSNIRPLVQPNNVPTTFSSSIQEVNGNSRSATNSKKKKPGIILNLNARQVVPEMENIALDVFGNDEVDGRRSSTVFCTTSAEEAREAARQMAQNLEDYSVLIPVGGDGTLCAFLQTVCEAIQEEDPTVSCLEQAMTKLPPIGYIPFGTGNGMGSVVGCKAKTTGRRRLTSLFRRKRAQLDTFEATLRRLASYPDGRKSTTDSDNLVPFDDLVEIPMIQVTRHTLTNGGLAVEEQETTTSSVGKSDLCFFAGVGFDSLMLNDFSVIKSWAAQRRTLPGFLKRWLGSVAGYCVALVVRTLPQCVAKGAHRVRVKVTAPATSSPFWIDHRRGDMMRRCTADDSSSLDASSQNQQLVVYEGTTGILAAGTCPFYGGGLRLFPFAGLAQPDRMHLRLGRIHPMTGFFNIPRIFAGTYRDPSPRNFGCLDFVGSEFGVQVVQDCAADGDADDRISSTKQEADGFPLQHSGESMGNVNEFRLKALSKPVQFVTFFPRRVVSDEHE